MASKFTAGMKNVVEVLNQMWDAFAAGPYNALPLSGGTMTGALIVPRMTATNAVDIYKEGVSAQEVLRLGVISGAGGNARTIIKMGYNGEGYGTRIVSGGDPTGAFAGYAAFEFGNGAAGYAEAGRFSGGGRLLLGTEVDNGVDRLQIDGSVRITPAGAQGLLLLSAGLKGADPSALFHAGDGAPPNYQPTVLYVGKNSITNRGFTTPGTVNTSGNDYAEYIVKSALCGAVAKGQIVGIAADNTITDLWAGAVLFSIKSTAPSFVGGDSWAIGIGARPSPQAGPAPTEPPRRADVIESQPLPGTEPQEYHDVVAPGDTDAEWAAKQAAYAAALAAHAAATQHDVEAMATFDAALEVERQKVDRIAIAGRVPVNVMGARPGDYIVPVQDGEGIAGIAVHADDITMPQYLRAVGRVISIEPDGRAYVMVKAV